MSTEYFNFLLLTGRAVLYPVYQGTFERGAAGGNTGTNAFRDVLIQETKDVSRSVDFLESRSDIQSGGVAYYGFSKGGTFGPLFLALEPRLKTGHTACRWPVRRERALPRLISSTSRRGSEYPS
jgi:cephalosporin-C deacetylase-like acetyl esterase